MRERPDHMELPAYTVKDVETYAQLLYSEKYQPSARKASSFVVHGAAVTRHGRATHNFRNPYAPIQAGPLKRRSIDKTRAAMTQSDGELLRTLAVHHNPILEGTSQLE